MKPTGESAKDYFTRKWPQYVEAVLDQAVLDGILAHLGIIPICWRDETWDKLLISKKVRKRLIKAISKIDAST